MKQYRAFLAHRQRAVRNNLSTFLSSDKRLQWGVGSPDHSLEKSDPLHDHDNPLRSLHNMRILPDIEAVSLRISRSLLPIVLKLKRSLRRDELKRLLLANHYVLGSATGTEKSKAHWLVDGKGRGIWHEDERIRLYVCPGVRSAINYFEKLSACN